MLSRVLNETARDIGVEQGSEDSDLLRQKLFVLFEVVRDEALLKLMLQRIGRIFPALGTLPPPRSTRRRLLQPSNFIGFLLLKKKRRQAGLGARRPIRRRR